MQEKGKPGEMDYPLNIDREWWIVPLVPIIVFILIFAGLLEILGELSGSQK